MGTETAEVDSRVLDAVKDRIDTLPFAKVLSRQASVVLTGSLAAGLADSLSDVDVTVLVPPRVYRKLYAPYWDAVDRGAISILNPRARLYNEYPITRIPGLPDTTHGHFQIKDRREIDHRIHSMDDVMRWITSNSIIVSDPGGVYARMRRRASFYPPSVLLKKRGTHFFAAKDSFYNLKMVLPRDQWQTIAIVTFQSINHVLKYACLGDGKPFPYLKWLYQVAVRTALGRQIREPLDAILAETRRTHVCRERPEVYVRPDHRNQEYEDYRLYHLFLVLFQIVDVFRHQHLQEEVK